MPIEAQIALACGIDSRNTLRNIAAGVVARYVMEFHLYGNICDLKSKTPLG